MQNNKYKKALLALSAISTSIAIAAPSMVAASCSHDLPDINISLDSNYTFLNKDGERVIKGSAKTFYETNSKFIFNPVASTDKTYRLFKSNLEINNTHDPNHIYEIKPLFHFLNFKNLTGPYDYRLFSFRYDDLVANIPGVASKSKYTKYQYNSKAVFIVLYWVQKTTEAALNFDADIIAPSKAIFTETSSYPIEEAPWPFLRDISPKLKGFWKDASEPLVLLFEEE
ncbi:hypothetical protein DMC14_002995 [Metamycoplasma phocicerebrale]|uniref:Uncharacterized protein n=1 Tax=Metamycoplasma phocicerebrale TaxID=142649 RepID=A0A3T0TUE1_9BACT|nr:hypothetical protein [Metamycoplasma phocicerebrale]AZZ65731.1 hypothetical protein DMC14_002995 [Metamycoplasma phocicerebrale]